LTGIATHAATRHISKCEWFSSVFPRAGIGLVDENRLPRIGGGVHLEYLVNACSCDARHRLQPHQGLMRDLPSRKVPALALALKFAAR
jgi:hypothetical protein